MVCDQKSMVIFFPAIVYTEDLLGGYVKSE